MKRSSVILVSFAESGAPSLLNNGILAVNNRRVNRWARALPLAGAAVAAACFLARAGLSLPSGNETNLVSGVWLALARDAHEGVFYRALAGSGEYGGTRYFPLFFMVIAMLMDSGISPLVAGQLASLGGAAVLSTGAFALVRGMGRPREHGWVAASFVAAGYFTQQSIFSIRVEPLAAGLVLWGSAFVARHFREEPDRWRLLAGSFCFGLAFTAKPTAIFMGAAAVVALLCRRRYAAAGVLASVTAALCVAVIGGIAAFSDGRAIESFRACALAGGSLLDVLRPANLGLALVRMMSSHLMAAMLVLSTAAVALSPRRLCELPVILLLGAALSAGVALATAGTIISNQSVEPFVASAIVLTWVSGNDRSFTAAGALMLTGLLLWTSAQNAKEIRQLRANNASATRSGEAAGLVERVRRCEGPVFAESPLLPVLAGTRIILLDPFAFRVAALKDPRLSADLITRLDRQEFACVVLEHDPQTDAGRGWYANVHLGKGVVRAVERSYEFHDFVAEHRFYTARNAPRAAIRR